MESIHRFQYNVYSQFGEDGIIQEVLKRIRPDMKVAVEFGGHDGYFCSNTALLRAQKWQVFMYDITPHSDLVMKQEITPENVNKVVRPCSILSIDTDGPCAGIWAAYEGKPDMVIIEINSSLPPMVDHYSPVDGASYITMLMLGISKGYFLLCHTGNLLLLLNKHRHLFPETKGDGIENWHEYFNTSWQ